jgi:hypothetical protein
MPQRGRTSNTTRCSCAGSCECKGSTFITGLPRRRLTAAASISSFTFAQFRMRWHAQRVMDCQNSWLLARTLLSIVEAASDLRTNLADGLPRRQEDQHGTVSVVVREALVERRHRAPHQDRVDGLLLHPMQRPLQRHPQWLRQRVAQKLRQLLEVRLLHRVHEPRDVHAGSVAKVAAKKVGIQGGGHEHDAQVLQLPAVL